jgi:hypothetical protein
MRKRNEVSEIRERFTDGSGAGRDGALPGEWSKALGVFAALFVAAVVAGVVLSGCGKGPGSHAQADVSAQSSGPADAGTQAQVAAVVAMPAAAQGGLSASDRAVLEGLPPDLSVSVADTLVAPGETIEFTVEGTDDVRQVALSDGRDEPTPFVRDEGTHVWRAQYRVPLHPKSERFGVSVTARNDADRWRRVWVFLHIETGDGDECLLGPIDNLDERADHR